MNRREAILGTVGAVVGACLPGVESKAVIGADISAGTPARYVMLLSTHSEMWISNDECKTWQLFEVKPPQVWQFSRVSDPLDWDCPSALE